MELVDRFAVSQPRYNLNDLDLKRLLELLDGHYMPTQLKSSSAVYDRKRKPLSDHPSGVHVSELCPLS